MSISQDAVTLRLTRRARDSEISALVELVGNKEWALSASVILIDEDGLVAEVHEVTLPATVHASSEIRAATYALDQASKLLGALMAA